MRKIVPPLLGVASLLLAGTAALAQPPGAEFERTSPPTRTGPSPGEQQDMHTGAPATNGSSSVGYDRYGAHADGFPNIRLANYSSFAGRTWRHSHAHRRHHRRWGDGS